MATDTDPTGLDTIVDRPDYYIEFLDSRLDVDDEARVKRLITELLNLSPGLRVLDVGSGTGDDTRRIAELVGADGQVIGIDHSPDMLVEARRRTEGTGRPVEFVEGDAQALDFPDASFDRARVERVLSHLPDPAAAVREMVRVTRPGGLVLASDIDAGTMFINSTDTELTTLFAAGLVEAMTNGWAGRRLQRYLVEAGLENVRCVASVIQNSVAFMRMVFTGRLQYLIDAGETTTEAVERFWAELDEGERNGWLCSGVVCFTVVGRKPA